VFDLRSERYASGDVLEVAGCPVRLRVDRRARRVSLRVDPARGEVIATAPSTRRLKEAAAFAAQRAAWIGEAVGRLPRPQPFGPGSTIELLGRPCRLARADSRRGQGLYEEGGLRLVAYGEGETFTRSAVRILKAHALKVLAERSAVHARALGQPTPKVAVMDARSRWGSCTPARGLRAAGVRYSWRLILAPWEVMDYVAAHECAHLVHADHSPKFWAVVRKLVGEARPNRAWLRSHGPRLHAIGR
jgi:predicted metal-dependent hydrolase